MPSEDLQLSFGGLTTGKGTPYRIRTITGLKDFTARTDDEATATRWGSLIGADMVDSSSITIEYLFPNDPDTIRDLEFAFQPAVQSNPAALGELAWKWPGEVEMMRAARCRRRSRAMTPVSERTNGPVSMFVELQAPDPRAYSTTVHQEALPPAGDDSLSLEFTVGSGADAAINFTASSGVNAAVNLTGTAGIGPTFVVNAGSTDTYPVVTFSAPGGMSHWRLRNLWTDIDAEFFFNLQPGQQMVVDFRARATPRLGDVVTVGGAARYAAWLHPRIPLALPAGTSQLRFDVLSGDTTGASALVEWQSAWI